MMQTHDFGRRRAPVALGPSLNRAGARALRTQRAERSDELKKTLAIIGAGIGGVAAALLALWIVATRPSFFHEERETVLAQYRVTLSCGSGSPEENASLRASSQAEAWQAADRLRSGCHATRVIYLGPVETMPRGPAGKQH